MAPNSLSSCSRLAVYLSVASGETQGMTMVPLVDELLDDRGDRGRVDGLDDQDVDVLGEQVLQVGDLLVRVEVRVGVVDLPDPAGGLLPVDLGVELGLALHAPGVALPDVGEGDVVGLLGAGRFGLAAREGQRAGQQQEDGQRAQDDAFSFHVRVPPRVWIGNTD